MNIQSNTEVTTKVHEDMKPFVQRLAQHGKSQYLLLWAALGKKKKKEKVRDEQVICIEAAS